MPLPNPHLYETCDKLQVCHGLLQSDWFSTDARSDVIEESLADAWVAGHQLPAVNALKDSLLASFDAN